MTSTDIPIFATSNLNSCERYLFLNHPTDFVPLTSESEHHQLSSEITQPNASTPCSSMPDQQQQRQQQSCEPTPPKPTAVPTLATNVEMQRQHSSSSTASTSNTNNNNSPSSSELKGDDYLGGGAVRHPFHSHSHAAATATTTQQHMQNLAQLAALSAETKTRRREHSTQHHLHQLSALEAQRQEWNRDVMSWWPLPLEVMEREWSEEFYD